MSIDISFVCSPPYVYLNKPFEEYTSISRRIAVGNFHRFVVYKRVEKRFVKVRFILIVGIFNGAYETEKWVEQSFLLSSFFCENFDNIEIRKPPWEIRVRKREKFQNWESGPRSRHDLGEDDFFLSLSFSRCRQNWCTSTCSKTFVTSFEKNFTIDKSAPRSLHDLWTGPWPFLSITFFAKISSKTRFKAVFLEKFVFEIFFFLKFTNEIFEFATEPRLLSGVADTFFFKISSKSVFKVILRQKFGKNFTIDKSGPRPLHDLWTGLWPFLSVTFFAKIPSKLRFHATFLEILTFEEKKNLFVGKSVPFSPLYVHAGNRQRLSVCVTWFQNIQIRLPTVQLDVA